MVRPIFKGEPEMPVATREQRESAERTVQSVRDDVRNWAKTADESEDFEVYDIIDGYLTYTRDSWDIVCAFDLEDEEPEAEPRDRTLNSLSQLVAFEYLERIAYEEWQEIQAERDNGDVFWCEDCGQWHEKEHECDDCEDGVCPKAALSNHAEDSEATYCDDCVVDHTCVVCHAIDSTVDFNRQVGKVLCEKHAAEVEAEREAEEEAERAMDEAAEGADAE